MELLFRVVDPAIPLTDAALVEIDASRGNVFALVAAGSRLIDKPTHASAEQRLIIRHTASGADRTLSLTTGLGGFRFGSDVTGLSATISGKTDYIGAIYNATDGVWDVVAVAKGY
jgi:hypothetical protein